MEKRVLGILIVGLGIVLLLSNFNVIAIQNFWGIFIASIMVTIGVSGLIVKKEFNFIYMSLLVLGTLGFLSNVGILEGMVIKNLIIPVVLISVGLSFVLHMQKKPTKNKTKGKGRNHFAIFGGFSETVADENFETVDIVVLFGGGELDLRKATFKEEKTYLNINVLFGGVELRVPEDVKVVTSGIPILGGIENKVTQTNSKKELVINYIAAFGGIEIKK